MKLYELIESCDSRIIGKYPQIEPSINCPSLDGPNSIQKLNETYRILKTDSIYCLRKGAKLTNVLSMGYKYFACDEKFSNIIHGLKCVNYVWITLPIENVKEKYGVFYFVNSSENNKVIDFDNTVFSVYDGLGNEVGDHFKINKENALEDWKKRNKENLDGLSIKVKKLVLKDESFHLLYLPPFFINPLISSKLKNSLEENEICGVEYKLMNQKS